MIYISMNISYWWRYISNSVTSMYTLMYEEKHRLKETELKIYDEHL